jgi:glycine oxidase
MEVVAFDAIITGAGIIGGSIAWRLAQAGLRVLLLDRSRMGEEASWAGAGMLAPGGEFEAPSALASFALESLRAYPAFVAELESETGLEIDYRRPGAIEVAASEADWPMLAARAGSQARMGIPACKMSREELVREVPLIDAAVAGGFYYPEDALVDPRQIMRALRAACVARGVEIREGVLVIAMRVLARSVQVITKDTILAAGSAVLAAGAWSSVIDIRGRSVPRAFPVRGHLMGFRMEPASLGPILRREHTYILQRSGGFTIAGTSSEQCGFDRALSLASLCDIQARASSLLPALAACEPSEKWLGFRPGVEGEGPIVKAVDGSPLWLAYGHYRNGILLAPATAARVSAGITANLGRDSCERNGSPL